MSTGSFAEYLAGLDEAALADLLRMRPDARIEPVPRSVEQLAQRLGGPHSLGAALEDLNGDTLAAGEAIAALGPSATVPEVARLLGASEQAVRDAVDDLCGRGLAWIESDARLRLPERLAEHWSVEIGGGRSAATIARSVLVNDLRAAVGAWGADVTGLRKPELIARLTEALADTRTMATAVAKLPEPARDRLGQRRHGYLGIMFGFGGRDPYEEVDHALAAAGLLLRVESRWEMPREVAVAAWLAERSLLLTGRPDIPSAEVAPVTVLAAAQAAISELLQAVTTLLDAARSNPITALKRGGVGPRERSRLAARLSLPTEVLLLAIDLTHAADLLGRVDAGYVPTDAYPGWRAAAPGTQWAVLVTAWFGLEHAPTSRDTPEDKEQPPPLPLASAAGPMRRALLRAARNGLSVQTTGQHIDWFFPLHGYEDAQRKDKVAAAVREAELLGIVAADVLTELGEQLLIAVDTDTGNPADELAAKVSSSLPETSCTVILQSDLTAVVSGRPGESVSRVLMAAATSETRGTAAVWRFTPESVRGALDAGWTSTELMSELAGLSDRPLPQPLEYLVTDVARRHGQVKVRGMRSCVVSDEATITEILHTRSLAKLQLARLAPTVLSSPFELDDVLVKLRAAGLSPVAEDASGTVIVEERPEHQTPSVTTAIPAPRARLSAAELAERLVADPRGDLVGDANTSETYGLLAALNTRLDDAELALLADAVDQQRDVLIAYQDRKGSRTVRAIQPQELYGRWLDSWCHLREGQRDFTVANIESVSPAG